MKLSTIKDILKFDYDNGTYEIITNCITIYKSNPKNGYPSIRIYNKEYMIHRLIWMVYYNIEHYKFLPKCIDHIDRNKHNFKIKNLRSVSIKENNKNRNKKSDPAKYGKCVYYNEILNQYTVRMAFDGGIKYTETFEKLEDATKFVTEKFNIHAYWLMK